MIELDEVNELKKVKTNCVFSIRIVVLTLALILSATSINAQIDKPINNKLDLNKIKPNQLPELTLKKSGFSVFVMHHNSTKRIGNVKLIFEGVGAKERQNVTTSKYGNYKIELIPGKYKVYAVKPGYISYVTNTGYNVVNYGEFGVLNIFLKKE